MTDDSGKLRRTRDTRFPKGKSGNPAGRPKKNKPIPEDAEPPLSKFSSMRFHGSFFGTDQELSSKERQELEILRAGFKGNLKAVRQVLGWIQKRRKIQHQRLKKNALVPIETLVEAPDPRDADAALLLLDIICEREEDDGSPREVPQYQMRAWAVETALKRRRGAKRIDHETLDWILAYTRDGSSVKLPKGYER